MQKFPDRFLIMIAIGYIGVFDGVGTVVSSYI